MITISVDGYEVISANAKKRCNKNEFRERKGMNVTMDTCKKICDKVKNCRYFAMKFYNKCKFYDECQQSAFEDANSHQTIYKKVEGIQNKRVNMILMSYYIYFLHKSIV